MNVKPALLGIYEKHFTQMGGQIRPGYSAMNVKPALLGIYEKHFTQMGGQIRPGMGGLLLGLLPGLEEGSEYYDRTNTLLEVFCEAAGSVYFFTCLWECILTCPTIRLPAVVYLLAHYNKKKSMDDQLHIMGLNIDLLCLPAVVYLLAHYNKKKSMDDQLHIMGLNIDLLVSAICSTAQDTSVLVQRSVLDFLVLAFPLQHGHLTKDDVAKIIQSTITVLLRRDMSLNRRLYAWLLGTTSTGIPTTDAAKVSRSDSASTTEDIEISYFQKHARESLVASLKFYLSEQNVSKSALKPFKMIITLLDKPEIGPLIIEDLFLDLLRCLYRECSNTDDTKTINNLDKFNGYLRQDSTASTRTNLGKKDEKSPTELIKTANILFNTLEPYFMWDYVARTFQKVCQGKQSKLHFRTEFSSLIEICDLVQFLLDSCSLETYMETTTEHLPDLLRHVLLSLTNHIDTTTDDEITSSLKLCAKILQKVQPSMTTLGRRDDESFTSKDVDGLASSFRKSPVLDDEEVEEVVNEETEAAEKEGSEVGEDEVEVEASDDETINDTEDTPPSETTEKTIISDFDITSDSTAISDSESAAPVTRKIESEDEFKKYNAIEISDASGRVSYKITGPMTLIQACVNAFQEFFHVYVTKRILIDPKIARKGLDTLTRSTSGNGTFSTTEKDSVLDDDSVTNDSDRFAESPVKSFNIGGNHIMKTSCDVFQNLCRLLVDFSSFPMYCTDYERLLKQTRKGTDNSELPDWLQEIITCCCYLRNFKINSIAISTILDLIILTKSVQRESTIKSTECRRKSMTEGTVSVVILPVLLPSHLEYINSHTRFYQTVTEVLWAYLAEKTSEFHQQTVDLFHQLHQLTPSLWICEDIIGRDLVSDCPRKKVEAFKKFARLWHLTRDKQREIIPGQPLRPFDRSMFMLLDSLKDDTSSCHSLAQSWLSHALQRGDLGRILEPLLLMLLHPDTARISVQHINVHQPKKVQLQEDDSVITEEAKIYAISNDGGNVLYHVSSPRKTMSRKNAESLKSYTLAVMNEKGNSKNAITTAPSRAQLDMPFERVNADDLNVCVNPLVHEWDLDKMICDGLELPSRRTNLANAKRLSRETCEKEGIVFATAGAEMLATSPLLADSNYFGDSKQKVENWQKGNDKLMENGKVNDIKLPKISEKPKIAEKPKISEKPKIADKPVNRKSVNENVDRLSNTDGVIKSRSEETVEISPTEIVKSLLDDLITDVLRNESTSNGSETDCTIPSKPRWLKLDGIGSSYGDQDLLNGIDKSAFGIDTPSESDVDLREGIITDDPTDEATGIHPLHMHMLLYTQKYDHLRVLYALSTFKTILNTCPKLVVFAMASSGIAESNTIQNSKLLTLLARHRKSVFGKNFFGDIRPDSLTSHRSSMYLEIFITVCLYYIRSYFPNFTMSKLTPDELTGNKDVHVLSTEILAMLMSHIVTLTKERNSSFSSYINDVLSRCKLQKSLLHSMLASVYNFRKADRTSTSLTETIVQFNEDNLNQSAVETFQIKLLQFVFAVITLEDEINTTDSTPPHLSEFDRIKMNFQPQLQNIRYSSNVAMIQQPMFIYGVLSALRQRHVSHLHQQWIAMVTSSLPFMGKAMPQIVLMVVSQLCRNLELYSHLYSVGSDNGEIEIEAITPDHMLTLLEGLTTMTLYCLLDTYTNVSITQSASVTNSDAHHSTQIMSNLLNIFNPVASREQSPVKEPESQAPLAEARRSLLKSLPRIIACLCTVWKDVKSSEQNQDGDRNCWIMGSPKHICKLILELLSPVSVPHGPHLLAAFAVAWNDSRKPHISLHKNVNPALSVDQQLLVDLLLEIRVLPMDTLVQTVRQVLRHPPHTDLAKNKTLSLEVNLLQLFYSYMTSCTTYQLTDSWTALLGLLREALTLQMPPLAIFLLLEIIYEFVMKTGPMDDRKQQKDLQEICQKIIEAVGNIAGSCLEQTTWLRRTYAVKSVPQADVHDGDNESFDETEGASTIAPQRKVIDPQTSTKSEAKYSVQALTLLAQRTTSMLDVVYGSEEKERIVPFLNSILYNVFPYLRNHTRQNLPSLRACSQILASISGYPYTRKAWRKEAMELFLDISFFQVDSACVGSWSTVIDNLMTHDKTTFKDLMSRVTVTQSNSLNLFSPKDQEFEQRSHLLKCLAFTIFCSEVDQYQRSMPDIQERLSESLRSPQIPSVMSYVFLCFRVLIMRMSPQHLTSLWPTIITEMVHVFMQVEQEMSSETEEFKTQLQRIAALDTSWAHLGNGLNAHNNPAWLQMYLSASKLLDLVLALPADVIPQFQLYRWAFIGDVNDDSSTSVRHKDRPVFIPHIRRINRLISAKSKEPATLPRVPGRPILTMTHIRSIQDLEPFFLTICQNDMDSTLTQLSTQSPIVKSRSVSEFDLYNVHNADVSMSLRQLSAQEYIESIIERDFLDTPCKIDR